MKFRADINALRAIAVMAVLFFHFNSSWIPGGFAGVDVFFTISGFLMTGIIIRGFETGNFALLEFYMSRARRIIPALSFLCLALFVFGWFFITPLDYTALSKHAASSVTFVSNMVYMDESGYFDSSSQHKWLLHTWSLSVEWQFYIIYPIAFVLLNKFFSVKTIRLILLFSFIASFILGVYASSRWPGAAYYLLPTRAWEMILGGLVFLYPIRNLSRSAAVVLHYVGLTLIAYAYFYIDKEMAWPGYLALIPVLGVSLVLFSNLNESIFSKNVALQKIGLWSYSIYLWHWPVVVFGNYFEIDSWYYLGMPISLILGWLSYHFIEKRDSSLRFFSISRLFFLHKPLVSLVIVSILASFIFYNDGYSKERYNSHIATVYNSVRASPLRDQCHVSSYISPIDSCEYFSNNIEWAVIGDSHTVELAYGLATRLRNVEQGIKHFSFSGCIPSYGENYSFTKCSRWYNDSVEYIINNPKIKNVIINHRYSLFSKIDINNTSPTNYVDDKRNQFRALESLRFTINTLADSKKSVYVMLPIPEAGTHINFALNRAVRANLSVDEIKGISREQYLKMNHHIFEFFEKNKFSENVFFIDPSNVYCDDKDCYLIRGGIPLYFDDNHPSLAGAIQLIKLFKF